MPGLFNKKILYQRINNYFVDNIKEKMDKIKSWQENLQNIQGLNEKRLQSAFLRAVFEDILEYKNEPYTEKWTMEIECSTDLDAKTPDGILGFYQRVNGEVKKDHRAVIELKGPQVSLEKDQKRKGATYKSPVDQAFSYTNRLDKCQWVIVSNFMEIRLYKVGRSKEYYEVFHLDELTDEKEFKRFYYLLSKNNLISKKEKSQTLVLSEATHKRHEDISVEFYNLYKNIRINLFEHLKENNENINLEILLEKAQKFLDRIIFICFCEDKGLLPNDLLHEAIKRGKESFSPSDTPIWNQIRGVFKSIDKGNPNHNINAYNGGLFEYDKVLDELTIKDEFFDAIYKISDFDFDSDVDVNILGHIFEQSITDIEKLKSDIKENEFDKNKSKRKKDGIYYTPQYITSYIVENAIGGYLEDIKEELGYYDLPDIEKASSNSWKTRYTNQHLEFYNEYEEKLKNIKVLDPACGSGAFLNQAFDYLLEEHQWLNKQRDLLKGGQSSIFAVETLQRNILKNNLFGVDLNEESVEITKLSLWLKTANKRKPLTNLDDNIKCGNSLIDDPEIAGGKAFDWNKEFKDIMEEGGFDVVIGNPPYVRQEEIKWMKPYFKKKYNTFSGTADLYVYFFEKSLNLLVKNGYFSFIVSNKFTTNKYAKNLREFLLQYDILAYKDYSDEVVFDGVSVDPCVIVIKKNINNKDNIKFEGSQIISQNLLTKNRWSFISKDELKIKEKAENKGILLKKIDLEINNGLKSGLNKAFIINENVKNKLVKKDSKSKEIIKPVLRGKDIKRYRINFNNIYFLVTKYNIDIPEKYPAIYDYLKKYKEDAKSRYDQGKNWWNLRKCSYYNEFERPKIIWPDISKEPRFYFDQEGKYYIRTTSYLMTGKNLKYLISILNSKLINYLFNKFYSGGGLGKEGNRYKKQYLKNIPIIIPEKKTINLFKDKSNKLINQYKQINKMNNLNFNDILNKYSSLVGRSLNKIILSKKFFNNIYTGRARKARSFTVNLNREIITIYTDKSGSGKYELTKFEENDRYKRRYIKYYLENLNEEQLGEINDKYKGNLLKKVLQIQIPDYDKDHVVKKVVTEWENLQQKINDLKEKIEKTDKEIDQMVYDLYNLTDEEINIVEENILHE